MPGGIDLEKNLNDVRVLDLERINHPPEVVEERRRSVFETGWRAARDGLSRCSAPNFEDEALLVDWLAGYDAQQRSIAVAKQEPDV